MNLDSLSQELDRLYEFEISEYIARCDELKKSGYKIFRNSSGQHKVVTGGQSVRREQQEQPYSYGYEEEPVKKKENIFIRAKNKVKQGVESVRTAARFIKFMYSLFNNIDNKRR